MSPNFALIISATTWNDPPVKKEKANGTHAKTKDQPSMPNRKNFFEYGPKNVPLPIVTSHNENSEFCSEISNLQSAHLHLFAMELWICFKLRTIFGLPWSPVVTVSNP